MIKLPLNNQWTQPNSGDRLGSLWGTKNVILDDAGYIKLSPRSVKLLDETTNSDFGLPVKIGRFGQGQFQIASMSDANFVMTISTSALSVTEDSGTDDPTLTLDSSGIFWQNRWHVSLASSVSYKDANGSASATWTPLAITPLTSGKNHALEIFDSRNQICVAEGNTVKEYNTSYSNTVTLTIPSDFEVVGLAYNNGQMGIITQSGLGSTGQLIEAKFYVWDGYNSSATGWNIGAEKALAIAPYLSSWVILTNKGELKLFNGGGFTVLSQFPFFFKNKWLESIVQTGNCMTVDGDRVYINIGLSLTGSGTEEQQQLPNLPSGIWCYDPKIGLYHRYSASASQAYLIQVDASGADTATDIFTAASGTIPASGNPIRLISGEIIEGFEKNIVYYVIKLSSSTFQLASTKELALQSVALDITTTNSSATYFHAYELIDYGVTYRNDIAAIALFGETSNMYTDVLFGGDLKTTSLGNNDTLCMCVPDLENRGWIITPRIYASEIADAYPELYLKFGALKDTDSIVVKVKDRDVSRVPISAPANANVGNDQFTWTGTNSGYTGADLSGALAHLNAGGSLEIEITAGPGAGQTAQITSMAYEDGTYSMVFEDSFIGVASTNQSYFIIDAWRKLITITSADNILGYRKIPVGSSNVKFVQFKAEMRGSNVIIEEIILPNKKAINA